MLLKVNILAISVYAHVVHSLTTSLGNVMEELHYRSRRHCVTDLQEAHEQCNGNKLGLQENLDLCESGV